MQRSEITKRYPSLKDLLDELEWLSPEEKDKWIDLCYREAE